MGTRVMMVLLLAAGLASSGCRSVGTPAEKAQARADLDTRSSEILSHLYAVMPKARQAVESAAGYATFNPFGTKIMIAGSSLGRGLAYNQRTKQTTYMSMLEVQAGLGMGIKKYRLIFVFRTEDALNEFIDSGFELGARADAVAKLEDTGASFEGAASIAKDVWLYQLTESGLALELTVKGTKFFKDDDLN